MIPHTLVLKPGLIIHSVHNGYWFWGRPSIEDLRHDPREVTRGGVPGSSRRPQASRSRVLLKRRANGGSRRAPLLID